MYGVPKARVQGGWSAVVHSFDAGSAWEAVAGRSLSLRPSLVYVMSSKLAQAARRNPDSKDQTPCPPKCREIYFSDKLI